MTGAKILYNCMHAKSQLKKIIGSRYLWSKEESAALVFAGWFNIPRTEDGL